MRQWIATHRQGLALAMTLITAVAGLATTDIRNTKDITLDLRPVIPPAGQATTFRVHTTYRPKKIVVETRPALSVSATFSRIDDSYYSTVDGSAAAEAARCFNCPPIPTTLTFSGQRATATGNGGIALECQGLECDDFALTFWRAADNQTGRLDLTIVATFEYRDEVPDAMEIWVE